MAVTTPVIVNTRRSFLDHTGIRAGGWIPLSPHHSTDEVMLHQFGAVYGEVLYRDSTKQLLATSMESNQDSAALVQQIQALAATVEELTRQNQEMKLWLQ